MDTDLASVPGMTPTTLAVTRMAVPRGGINATAAVGVMITTVALTTITKNANINSRLQRRINNSSSHIRSNPRRIIKVEEAVEDGGVVVVRLVEEAVDFPGAAAVISMEEEEDAGKVDVAEEGEEVEAGTVAVAGTRLVETYSENRTAKTCFSNPQMKFHPLDVCSLNHSHIAAHTQ